MNIKKLAISLLILMLVASLAGSASPQIAAGSASNPGEPGLASAVPGWQQVNTNGFGDPGAGEVSALGAFNGYLYAGTHNPIDPAPLFDGAQIFRSSNGITWNPVIQPGFGNSHDTAPPAILDFLVFNSYLYASTGRGNAAKIFRSLNGVNWAPVVNTGFGDPDNMDITALATYNGKIYAGVTNAVTGAQIWTSFNGDSNSWTQATTPALADSGITGFANFDGGLYAAVQSQGPAQIWSSYGGAWTAAVSDGFGDSDTTLTGGMAVFGGDLYVGAGNTSTGAQLWRTNDGTNWSQVIAPAAFGDANNLKVELVFVFQNQLYVSAQNTATGLEVWRTSDVVQWEQANLDGFGDSHNAATNYSNAVENFGSQLYVGTSNPADGGELWRMLKPYGVQLSANQALSGPPGQTLTYSLGITNTGSLADSFDLAASGQTWTTSLSSSIINLAPSASAVFSATVAIPPGAADQATDTVTITASSQGDGSQSDSATLTSTAIAAPVYGVTLSPNASLSGPAGGQVSYTVAITNTGNVVDTYDLLLSGQAWTTTLSTSSVNLAPSASAVFTATVAIPPGAADQATDAVTITATSQGDSSKTKTATLTSTAIAAPVYGVALSPDASLSGPAGGQVSYSVAITNTGNVVDTYDLLLSGNNWATGLSSNSVNLAAGGRKEVTINVSIPPAAVALASDQVTVQVKSRHDPGQQDIAVLTTVSTGQLARIYLPTVMMKALQ